jgi:GAF domain-containing protein
VFDRNSSSETSDNLSIMPPAVAPTVDESTALSSLKDMIEVGDRTLDSILTTIVDTARQLTGASAGALAMWKDGAMVCRARSGDTAPPLGAELSAGAGISGECLSTGRIQNCADTENDALVDMDVCRTLGLRSIAVLPIRDWRDINGILEVFSTQPDAFGEQQLVILEELAALAERARALQPQGAAPPETQAFR